MDVGCAPQMSHHLARDSVEHEEQWLHRSKVLQSVGSFNTKRCKSTSPQLSQYDVSIAARMGVMTKQMVLMTALLLHLLALLLATIVNVVVNASVVGAVTVASLASASPCTRLTFNIPLLTYVAPAFVLCFCFCFFLLLLVFLCQPICAIVVLP